MALKTIIREGIQRVDNSYTFTRWPGLHSFSVNFEFY